MVLCIPWIQKILISSLNKDVVKKKSRPFLRSDCNTTRMTVLCGCCPPISKQLKRQFEIPSDHWVQHVESRDWTMRIDFLTSYDMSVMQDHPDLLPGIRAIANWNFPPLNA